MNTDPRPSLNQALQRLLQSLAAHCDDLNALDTNGVLCVGMSAWGTAAASVRGLTDCATKVTSDGKERYWELALRPPFFMGGDPTGRLATLAHELLHIDTASKGELLTARRHRHRSHAAHEAQARAAAKQWLERADLTLLEPLGHHGEVLLSHWRVRPILDTNARRFTGRDLYQQPVRMHTAKARRTVQW